MHLAGCRLQEARDADRKLVVRHVVVVDRECVDAIEVQDDETRVISSQETILLGRKIRAVVQAVFVHPRYIVC